MQIRALRKAIIDDIAGALKPDPFKAVIAGPRTATVDWINTQTRHAPLCIVAWIGIRRMGRMPDGRFTGPLQMAAHVIAQEVSVRNPADEVVMDLAERLMNHIELNTFGLDNTEPAQVTSCEYVWDHVVDNKGFAVATVLWDQKVLFGTNNLEAALAAEYGPPSMIPEAIINGQSLLIPDPDAADPLGDNPYRLTE